MRPKGYSVMALEQLPASLLRTGTPFGGHQHRRDQCEVGSTGAGGSREQKSLPPFRSGQANGSQCIPFSSEIHHHPCGCHVRPSRLPDALAAGRAGGRQPIEWGKIRQDSYDCTCLRSDLEIPEGLGVQCSHGSVHATPRQVPPGISTNLSIYFICRCSEGTHLPCCSSRCIGCQYLDLCGPCQDDVGVAAMRHSFIRPL